MGVEIKVEHLTKSFGRQLIWGDVTLTNSRPEHVRALLDAMGAAGVELDETADSIRVRRGAGGLRRRHHLAWP